MNELPEEKLVFALDIGTRSVIGIAGYSKDGLFHICCTEKEDYKNRVVVDGQIEDIAQTAETAGIVKARMEQQLGRPLQGVYIAAAGRALQTVDATAELEIENGIITDKLISKLEFNAIQTAYAQISQEAEQPFFCVGHAVKTYLLDGYALSSLLDHKGKIAQVTIIATFLPKEVVESLYTTMQRIGLTISGLTLEPIAAMNAIIPTDLRKLNLALCDIGAGTSDIALCDNGSISGYTMVTVAGDEITEAIMQACLVDFSTAERVKQALSASLEGVIFYENILAQPVEEPAQQIFEKIKAAIEHLAKLIADKVLLTNGKAPSAMFLVGGGSQTPGLCKFIAENLQIDASRIAVGGSAHLKKKVLSETEVYGPEYATPLGIALTAVDQQEVDVSSITVNGEKIHLFSNWDTSILGVLQMSGYHYSDIMGHAGKNITYTLNGQRKAVYGGLPTPSQVTLNGEPASLSDIVVPGDILCFSPVNQGIDASIALGQLAGVGESVPILLNGVPFSAGCIATINGVPATMDTPIKSADIVELQTILTAEQLVHHIGEQLESQTLWINGLQQSGSYLLKPNDDVQIVSQTEPTAFSLASLETPESAMQVDSTSPHKTTQKSIFVTLNGHKIELTPKADETAYQFFDLLPFTKIDPKHPEGELLQTLNGKSASYLAIVQDGDQAEIGWSPQHPLEI